MKTIVISDIHGTTTWKKILDKEKTWDQIILLGDYFDPYSKISIDAMIENFEELTKLKNVIFLMGNHDYHYIHDNVECSRYDYFNRKTFRNLLLAVDIKYWFIIDDIILSHAGISKVWLDEVSGIKSLNEIPESHTFAFNLYSNYDMYGNSPTQSPIWIRPEALINNKLEGYRQVVGHTKVNDVITIHDVTLTDNHDGYVIIENKEIIIKKL